MFKAYNLDAHLLALTSKQVAISSIAAPTSKLSLTTNKQFLLLSSVQAWQLVHLIYITQLRVIHISQPKIIYAQQPKIIYAQQPKIIYAQQPKIIYAQQPKIIYNLQPRAIQITKPTLRKEKELLSRFSKSFSLLATPRSFLQWLRKLLFKSLISFALAVGLLGSLPQTSMANIDDYMRRNLDSVSNYTAPGYSNHFNRGVYYGGSYALRNQLMTINLINFDAPYIDAGCGGLDLYGGSLSFINKEQFTLLLKSVASNAVGYSFSLALNHVCPTCSQTVEALQRKIQQMNQFLGNSCALAQGLVNDTVAAFTNTKNNKVSLLANLRGMGDTFSTFSSDKQSQKASLTQEPTVKDKLYGNLLYNALRKTYGKTYKDDYYLEIVALAGTVISAPQAAGKKQMDKVQVYPGELISLKGIITGGKINTYKCAGKNCDTLQVVTTTRQSLAQKIKQLYLGQADATNESNLYGQGLIGLYETNQGQVSDSQRRDLAMVGQGINAYVRNLAIVSPDAARNFVMYAVEYIALNYAQREIEQAFRLAHTALQKVVDDDFVVMQRKLIQENQLKYLQYLQAETTRFNPAQVLNYYTNLYNSLQPQQGGVKGK